MEKNRVPRKKTLYTYGQLIYHKEGKMYNGEKTVSSISGAWKTGQLYVKKKEISIFSSTYININLKQLKDLNMTRNHKF